MAPVTRSSLHGRSVSKEGSWQVPTEEDLMPDEEAITQQIGTEVEIADDETTEEDQSDEDFDGAPFQERQGMLSHTINK